MTINEHAAYIKGMYDALGTANDPNVGKLLGEMLTLMEDMADKIEALGNENRQLHDLLDELDHDLGDVEEMLYDTTHSDDEYEDEGDEEDEDDNEDEDSFYEVECPHCGETVCFDDSLDPDDLICPACGEKIGGLDFCDGECEGCTKDCPDKE